MDRWFLWFGSVSALREITVSCRVSFLRDKRRVSEAGCTAVVFGEEDEEEVLHVHLSFPAGGGRRL